MPGPESEAVRARTWRPPLRPRCKSRTPTWSETCGRHPHGFPERNRFEPRGGDVPAGTRGLERTDGLVDAFSGQLKGAEVHWDALRGAKIQMRLHCLGRIHVHDVHEPTRLVGA